MLGNNNEVIYEIERKDDDLSVFLGVLKMEFDNVS